MCVFQMHVIWIHICVFKWSLITQRVLQLAYLFNFTMYHRYLLTQTSHSLPPALLRYTWWIRIVYIWGAPHDDLVYLYIYIYTHTYTHTHCDMVTKIKLINISITLNSYIFVCGKKLYSLSKFQEYNTVLVTRVTMLSISSPELMHGA